MLNESNTPGKNYQVNLESRSFQKTSCLHWKCHEKKKKKKDRATVSD